MVPLLYLSKLIPFFFLFSLHFRIISPNTQVAFIYNFCLDRGNYTQNSLYQTNLNLLLSTLPDKASLTSFYNSTMGNSTDKAYTLFLCRGDITPQVCQDCVKTASEILVERCPNQKEAIIWYEECMLRYSNRSIFSIEEEYPSAYWHSQNFAPNISEFSQILADEMDELTTAVAYGSTSAVPFFVTGEANITVFQKLYCLVQCTPDITAYECNRCLRVAIGDIQSCCEGNQWTMISLPSCQLRYDTAPFYEVKTPQQIPPPLQPAP